MRRTDSTISVSDVLYTLKHKPIRWLVPVVIISLTAFVFALVRPRTWEAMQAMVVRDEVSTDSMRQPTSTRADDLKSAQESILELAQSQPVLRGALEQVGPGPRDEADGFPTLKNIEQLGEAIKLVPPKGGEFGKTDFFYLKAAAPERERALALATAVSHQVQASFEDLRKTKIDSSIQELEKTVDLAREELSHSTDELAKLEHVVGGADLSELRILNEMPSGNSDIRNEGTTLENEFRKERTDQQTNRQLLEVLQAADVNPGELLACPNSLLNSQPSLKRLKDGLVDAQLKSAMLLGSMSADHPQVIAARTAEQEIGENLHRELAIAIKGVQADIKLSNQRIDSFEQQKAALRARLDRLVDVRARYGNLVTALRQRGEVLKAAETELAEARAKLAATQNGSLLQLIGTPVTGTRPMGPGRTAIVAAGILGGLLVGLGIVVLTAEPQANGRYERRSAPNVPPIRSELPKVVAATSVPTETVSVPGETLSLNQALDRIARLKQPV